MCPGLAAMLDTRALMLWRASRARTTKGNSLCQWVVDEVPTTAPTLSMMIVLDGVMGQLRSRTSLSTLPTPKLDCPRRLPTVNALLSPTCTFGLRLGVPRLVLQAHLCACAHEDNMVTSTVDCEGEYTIVFDNFAELVSSLLLCAMGSSTSLVVLSVPSLNNPRSNGGG
ncbi:hypothetical protein CYLTODRAFT_162437 [Cylindrobasidium torrendii FP15055 ss-10]|uniref:Uncharacterized protein n=1 Tax=Cylindrobasidium torrendii FP15055 ss-10 TaxID=1314674 RepID=A0A0D7B015_9AGAR|nr:hypothetical protein CYLTODRAFT_162437 [Cylindrobasidium torrendii FP15055 ss-10]